MSGRREDGSLPAAPGKARPRRSVVRRPPAPDGAGSTDGPLSVTEMMLRLQRAAGNAAISGVMSSATDPTAAVGMPRGPTAGPSTAPVVARETVGAVMTGDVLPPPVPVVWGSDPFLLQLSRSASGEMLDITLRYQGTFGFEGSGGAEKAMTASVRVGRPALAPRIRYQGASSIVIDLYGDASEFLRITDTVRVGPRPSGGAVAGGGTATMGRQHSLSAMLTQFSGGGSGSGFVQDPAAARKPAPTTAADDRLGAPPRLTSLLGDNESYEGLVDGDGDQRKELSVRISRLRPAAADAATTRIRVILRLAVDGTQLLDLVGELPVRPADFFFAPMVTATTDGDRPTIIPLAQPANRYPLTITPPRPGSSPKYTVSLGGVDTTVPAPGGQGRIGRTFAAGMAGSVIYNDLKLGAYEDRFRLSLQWRSGDRALLGLAPLFRGQPSGGYGVEIPASGVLRCQVVDSSAVSVGFDLSGDGVADLRLYDGLTSPADSLPERDRDHTVRVVGAAVGGERSYRFPVRRGQPLPVGSGTAENKIGASNALAITGLSEQRRTATYAAQLDEYEMAMMKVRGEAATAGAIPASLYTAWASLSSDMIKIRAQLAAGAPRVGLQSAAVGHAQDLFTKLAAETVSAAEPRYYQVGYGSTNPYTGEKTDHVITQGTKTSGAGPELAGHIAMSRWRDAFDGYQALVSGMDRWVAKRLQEIAGKHDKLTERAEFLVSSRSQLAALEKYKPTRVLAVFQPDQKFSAEGGWVEQIPMNLYYYRDGDTWYLKNLTNPNKTWHKKIDAPPEQTVPPTSLFAKLNDSDRLPEGKIHYEVPGAYGGEVVVRSELTFRKFLSYLGVGLALLGLTLATAGTGSVAVAGSWALAGSALVGGLSATLDLLDKADSGDLTATTAVIDIAQIVGSVAGVTALRAGRIAQGGMLAASEGNPLLGEAARAAARAHRVYVISTGTRVAADLVTVVTMGIEVAGQLDDIENGPGDRTSKDRAKALLLAQLAVTGGITALSIKGELPQLGGGRKLTLFTPKGSTVPIALVEGTAAPGSLKFSQSTIANEITDKSMTVEQLAESMRTGGWKGDPLHVMVLDDGTYLSLDNRRLWAAHQAKLPEVPIWYHSPKEKFPKEWANDGFILRRYNIYQRPDGSFTTTKAKDTPLIYAKGREPATLWEAALFRTADQGNIAEGVRFPMWGSYDLPKIRVGKTGGPAGTE